MNGKIYFGMGGATPGARGLRVVNYSTDSLERMTSTDDGGGYHDRLASNIANRNTPSAVTSIDNLRLINETANDVHAAVINGKTYVAVATDGGVSLINETDGTVIHGTDTTRRAGVVYISGSTLYSGVTALTGSGGTPFHYIDARYNIQNLTSNYTFFIGVDKTVYSYLGSAAFPPPYLQGSLYSLNVTPGTSTADGISNTIYVGSDSGINAIQEKQGDESNGSVKYYTKDMITEEMIGDIRGMWDFSRNTTVSNNDQVEEASSSDTDLTSVNGATVVDGVRGKAFQFNGSSQYLKQKTYLTETGSTWGPSTHNLSLANGSAFFRAGETVGSEIVSNAGAITQTDWLDSNSDGMADYWIGNAPTYYDATASIVTGNGFSGNAQRISGGSGSSKDVIYQITNSLADGKLYKITFKYRSSTTLYVMSGDSGWVIGNVPGNSGTALTATLYAIRTAGSNKSLSFKTLNGAGQWYEIDEVSIKEVTSPNLSTYKGTDSGLTPYMIAVKDSANKTAWGYLGNSDAGETLGSDKTPNLTAISDSQTENSSIGSWVPYSSYPTPTIFESTSEDKNTGSYSFKTVGSVQNSGFFSPGLTGNGLTAGKLYKVKFDMKVATGSVMIWIRDAANTKYLFQSSFNNNTWQTYTYYFTAADADVRFYVLQGTTTTSTWYFDNFSIKEVTDTQIDGVHIMSTRNGTTRNWAGIETGFNYNDTAYTFEILKSDFNLGETFTMGAWVKTNVTDRTIFSKYNANVASGPQVRISSSGTITYHNGATLSMTGTRVITDNNWHHVVYAQSSVTDHKIYIDGTLELSSTESASGHANSSTPFQIGAYLNNGVPMGRFSGTIDEPFVTAEALTDAQILSMYQKGLGALNHANKTEQKLAGTSNVVSSVWAQGNLLYAATSSVNGAVSVIDMNQDSVTKFFSTASTPALLSNDSLSMAIAGSHSTTPTLIVGSNTSGVTNVNSNPTTISRVTTTPKFGAASLKLDNSTATMSATYTFTDTLTVNPYTLSAYAYTDGNQVTASDLNLYTDDQPATSSATFEDAGGGWTRVKTTFTGQPKAAKFGLQVKPGKTIYLDGIQLEPKRTTTSYTDGSLGTGYSWTGAQHNSMSNRTLGAIKYNASNINPAKGSISMWFNPDWQADDNDWRFLFDTEADRFYCAKNNANYITCAPNVSDNPTRSVRTASLVNPTIVSPGKWTHFLITYDQQNDSIKLFLNGIEQSTIQNNTTWTIPQYQGNLILGDNYQSGGSSNVKISDFKIYDQPLTTAEISQLYNQGLQTHSNSPENDDRYVASGTYTSPVMDLGANGQFSNWSITQSLNGGSANYFTRTSPDNLTWSDWSAVTGSAITSEPRKYLQWRADLTSADQATTPVISNMAVTYVEDSTAPTNPSATALGFSTAATPSANLTSSNWYNYQTPKFTFETGGDSAAIGQSSSGIDGYHLLLTKTADLTPNQHPDDPCYQWLESDNRTYQTSCPLTDGTYYLRLQTKDNSGNFADPVTIFTYRYDGTTPTSPSSVSSTTVGYTSQNAFTFFWPAATDAGGSQIQGYEYKTGAVDGSLSDWTFTADTQAASITAYQEGQNFFFVRTIDNAGNVSAETSNAAVGISPFYFNSSAPTAPQNVVISPSTSSGSAVTTNIFTVSWDKPASYSGEIAKYYYCVNCTPSVATMTETTPAETINQALSNLALATQQGKNTFYILAEDNSLSELGHGNRNFDAYATVDFYAATIAPAAPTTLTISDVSDREAEAWRLTLAWKQGAIGGTPARYDIFRQCSGVTEFTKIGSTTSTAYTDADLEQGKACSYYIKAVDSAGSTSIASNTVTRAPEGRFAAPPTAGGTPSVSLGPTTAVIQWTTSRPAFGSVEYGLTDSFGSTTAESTAVTNHRVKLMGLIPGTTYHYRVQSLDDSSLVGYERAAAYTEPFTFTTLSRPEISDITISDINLDSVLVSWKTVSLASTIIDYGETTEYGESLIVTTSASSSSHMAKLTGLKHSTTYHFRVKGITSEDTGIYSEDNTFTTQIFPKVTAMVFDTDQGASGTSVVVAWSTNIPTTGTVEYQTVQIDPDYLAKSTANLANPSVLQSLSQTELLALPVNPVGDTKQLYSGKLETRHVMRLSGLEDASLYVITLRGRDANGLEAVSEPWRYVTGADTRPPRIENLMVETPLSGIGSEAKGQLIVSWDTDEPASGQILWGRGTGSEYPQASEKESALGTSHVIVLRDLDPTTSFHFKLVVTDAAGNTTESEDTVIVTPAAPQAALDIIFKNLSDIFGFLKL